MTVMAAAIALLGAIASPTALAVGTSANTPAYVCGRGLESPPCESRPVQLEFSDNHDLVAAGMTWTGWGRSSTVARGDITVNWSGKPKTQVGTVTLSDLRPCHGQRAYRKGRVSWAGESVIVRFDCRPMPRQARYVEFHSADGAVGCGLMWDLKEGSSARCDVQGASYQTPLTADCTELDQGDSLVLAETVTSTCHGDTVLRAGHVLKQGHSKRVGDIRCTMTQSGVRCRNLVTGHGFQMSKASYRIW
jgi:hypothetical protein